MILFISSASGFGQEIYDIIKKKGDEKYASIDSSIRLYVNNLPEESAKKELKHYARWLMNNSKGLTSEGYFINKDKYFIEHTDEINALFENNSHKTIKNYWEPMGPTQLSPGVLSDVEGIGRVNCIEIDPSNESIIYIGTPESGLYRSIDDGSTWTSLINDYNYIGVADITIDYNSDPNNRTIYALTGDPDRGTYSSGILKSINNGISWFPTSLGYYWSYEERHVGNKLAMHPTNPNKSIAAFEEGLFLTEDGWNTYTLVKEGIFYDVVYKPIDPAIVFASTKDGKIYKSEDGGFTWHQKTFQLPSGLASQVKVKFSIGKNSPDILSAIFGINDDTPEGKFGGLYQSFDEGESWTFRSNSPVIFGMNRNGEYSDGDVMSKRLIELSAYPGGSNFIFAGGVNLYRSRDNGTTWEMITYWVSDNTSDYIHADIRDLEATSDFLYAATDGGIFRMDLSTNTWEDLSSGLDIAQIYHIGCNQYNDERILYGAQDNGVNNLENSVAVNWADGDGNHVIHIPGTDTLICSNQTSKLFYMSGDYGISDLVGRRYVGSESFVWPFIDLDHNDYRTLLIAKEDIFLARPPYKMHFPYNNWTNISNGETGDSGNRPQVVTAPGNSNLLFASRTDKLYRGEKQQDGTVNWQDISGNLPAGVNPISSIIVCPHDYNTIWVSYRGVLNGNVLKTTNGGATWVSIFPSELIPFTVSVNDMEYQFGSDNRIYVATDIGVFYFEGNDEWHTYSDGFPRIEVFDLEIDYSRKKLLAGTLGKGVWQVDIPFDEEKSKNFVHTFVGIQSIKGLQISSSSKIMHSSTIEFNSSGNILLLPGFSVEKGCSFKAMTNVNP